MEEERSREVEEAAVDSTTRADRSLEEVESVVEHLHR